MIEIKSSSSLLLIYANGIRPPRSLDSELFSHCLPQFWTQSEWFDVSIFFSNTPNPMKIKADYLNDIFPFTGCVQNIEGNSQIKIFRRGGRIFSVFVWNESFPGTFRMHNLLRCFLLLFYHPLSGLLLQSNSRQSADH